jgi:hypothetical protein
MVRGISILTIACLCLIFGMGNISHAAFSTNPDLMQEHIEKMKREKPQEYQAKVQRAGGNITDCCSCHTEVCKEKNMKRQ